MHAASLLWLVPGAPPQPIAYGLPVLTHPELLPELSNTSVDPSELTVREDEGRRDRRPVRPAADWGGR